MTKVLCLVVITFTVATVANLVGCTTSGTLTETRVSSEGKSHFTRLLPVCAG